MFKHPRPWLRFIDAPVDNPGAGAPGVPPVDAPPASDPQPPVPEPNVDEKEDPAARGSKTQVLADLAKERDKRQAVEAERDEFKKQVDQFQRTQMTELEKAQADLQAALARNAELEQQAVKAQRDSDVQAALKASGLPAEMAGRLAGDTAAELLADATALAAAMGADRKPIDPAQGKYERDATAYRDLAEATRAKLGITP